jgi:hypothetical protein
LRTIIIIYHKDPQYTERKDVSFGLTMGKRTVQRVIELVRVRCYGPSFFFVRLVSAYLVVARKILTTTINI